MANKPTDRTSSSQDAPALGPVGMLRWAWSQLTKMNTALFLLLMLAVASVPGSILPQRIQDPAKVSEYIEAHPTWGPIADKVQLFDVFSSFWFASIYILLFVSLIGCVFPRSVKHAKVLRQPPARTPKNFGRLPVRRTITIPAAHLSAEQAVKDAQAILKKRSYRTELRLAEAGPSVGAERGYLREIGNIVFHLAMIGVIIGIAIGSLFGHRGQKILVEGDTFVNSLISYDSFTPGTNYNPDWLEPFAVTLNSFEVQYDRQTNSASYGQDIDYTAELTVTEKDGSSRDETLKVNEPINVGSTSMFLAGNGYAPIVKVLNSNGEIAYEGPVVGLTTDGKYTSSIVLKVPDAEPDQLGFVGMFLPTGEYTPGTVIPHSIDAAPANPMLVLQSYYGDLGLDTGVPQNVYVLDTEDLTPLNTMQMGNGIVLDSETTQVNLPGNRGSIIFEGVKRYIGVDIHHDPGKMLVFWSSTLAFIGLISSLFIPRRRVWVKAKTEGEHLIVEYGLLARGEDPRLATEADKLTELFAQKWGLEWDDPQETEGH